MLTLYNKVILVISCMSITLFTESLSQEILAYSIYRSLSIASLWLQQRKFSTYTETHFGNFTR